MLKRQEDEEEAQTEPVEAEAGLEAGTKLANPPSAIQRLAPPGGMEEQQLHVAGLHGSVVLEVPHPKVPSGVGPGGPALDHMGAPPPAVGQEVTVVGHIVDSSPGTPAAPGATGTAGAPTATGASGGGNWESKLAG